MKFYLFGKNSRICDPQKSKAVDFQLDQDTSVLRYYQWLYECLGEYGEFIHINGDISPGNLSKLLNKPDAILISWFPVGFISKYPNVPMRALQLSLGSHLIRDQWIFSSKCLPSAQVELVSTEFEAQRLKKVFGKLLPKFYVFPPRVDVDFFVPPSSKERLLARKNCQVKEGQIHLLFAGRLVTTKGICQLIRALDLWPIPNVVLTIVGDIDTIYKMPYSSGTHFTFPKFLEDELLHKRRSWLKVRPSAKTKEELRELFWSADLMINPSVQPDENFGITPREAASCGLPVVTTNFGGLYPLAESMPWRGLDTYPTHSGSRFSLKQLHRLLLSAINQHRNFSPEDYRRSTLEQCSPAVAKKNLKSAVEYLRNRRPEKSLNYASHIRKIVKRYYCTLDPEISEIFLDKKQLSSSGLSVYGDSPRTSKNFPIVQGICSAQKRPPLVKRDTKWRGFFRASSWEQERAIVEFGFPGPRIKRYSKKSWASLKKCVVFEEPGECVMIPKNKNQVAHVQELVNLGYLVSD